MSKHTFSEEEKDRIEAAVKASEVESCGEIVPFYVASSDNYSEAPYYLSFIFSSLTALVIALLSYSWLLLLPVQMTPVEVSLVILGSGIIGYAIPLLISSSKRWIISSDKQRQRVGQRAAEAFLTEKVFQTEERVGILIFISHLEHQVLVVGDEGINAKVSPDDWQNIVNAVVNGIKNKDIASGIVDAIGLSKDLLLSHGFVRKSTDFNELSDGLRIED